MGEDCILKSFGKPRVLLPVIHTVSRRQAGADGVFLINQRMSADEVLGLVPDVGQLTWVGVNLLGLPLKRAHRRLVGNADAIWTDEASQSDLSFREESGDSWGPVLWFGGACFKYTPGESGDPAAAVSALRGLVDVVTTSGAATGSAAPTGKVSAFLAALGGRPLALASGVTPENVRDYPDVRAFLVASGIESEFGVLDPVRTKALADAIHGERE